MSKPFSPRSALLLLLFLTSLNILNFVDRQLIVNLAPLLTRELGLKLAEVAWLYGYIFLVFYTVMGLVIANLADRYRRERLIAGGLGLWSALTAASGAAVGFLHLAMARMLVGVGEAALVPASISMLSDAFPPRRRALAAGVFYAGVPLGSGLSLIVVGWMAPRYGWRTCFYSLGMIGLVLTPLVLLLKTPPRGAMEEVATAPVVSQSNREIYSSLFATLRWSPALWLTISAAVLLNFSTTANSLNFTWMVRERGMDFGRTGIVNGLVVMIAGLWGTSGGGGISDWFHRRWAGGRLLFLIFKAGLILPFTIGLYSLPTDAPYHLFYVCYAVCMFGSFSWYGPMFATVQDLAPARIRATAVAFFILVINVFGTGLGPLVVGKIGDAYSLWQGLAICSCVGYFSVIPLYFAARQYRNGVERARADEAGLAAVPGMA